MKDLKKVLEIYQIQNIDTDEYQYVEMVSKYINWQLMDDMDKLYSRKQDRIVNQKFGSKALGRKYEDASIVFLELVIQYLKENEGKVESKNYIDLTDLEKIFFRIYCLMYSEKAILLFSESLRGTKFHIPYKIFEPLIEKIRNYKETSLEKLLEEYKKMLELFAQKPYE